MDDKSLWNSFLKGNRLSFQAIYSKYYQNLYSYGMRKINQSDVVRDCIHDLFVNLWATRDHISETDNIKYYLLASFRNLLNKANSRDTKWEKVDLTTLDAFEIQFDVESDYIKNENISQKANMIIKALDKLTPREKEIIYLRYFEELSYEEIADMLSITIRSVYKLNYRALDSLKLILGTSKLNLLLILAICKTEWLK